MDDLQATRLCAEAMGWKHLGAVGIPYVRGEMPEGSYWCMSGANDFWLDPEGFRICAPCQGIPDPLHDDAQAMALVKRFRLEIRSTGEFNEDYWSVGDKHGDGIGNKDDLNRAIVYCVASMQEAKNG